MTSLWLTLPLTLLLAATLVALVVRAARRGEYDDWEGPAARMIHDDDSSPEIEGDPPSTGALRAGARRPESGPEAQRRT